LLFTYESRIPALPERVFKWHEQPGALQHLTPPWEEVTVQSGGDSLKPGTRVQLRTRVGPFRLTWIAEHTEYQPPHLFADTQIRGPFKRWYHRHRFLYDGTSGTLLRDEIEYELHFGILGRLVAGSMVRRKLEKLFSYRHEMTRKLLSESG
jgi:ligand-binding SRPBCC domain-containing protein